MTAKSLWLAHRRSPFEEIWFVDFEFISRAWRASRTCSACVHMSCAAGGTSSCGRTRLGPTPPYRTDDQACLSASPQMPNAPAISPWAGRCRARCSTCRRCSAAYINGRNAPAEGKGLIGALRHFGLDTVGEQIQGRHARPHPAGPPVQRRGERPDSRLLHVSDIDGLPALLEKLLDMPLRRPRHRLALGRVRRGVRGDGTSWRSDRHGDLPTCC